MANKLDLNGKVWRLDTAAVVTTDRVRLKGMRWYSKSATAGDDLSVEDKDGEKDDDDDQDQAP